MADSTLHFSHDTLSSHVRRGIVTATADLVSSVRSQVERLYMQSDALPGSEDHNLPTDYVATYFAREIAVDTEQYIFKHFVLDYLMRSLIDSNIVAHSWPRLAAVHRNEKTGELSYEFTLAQAPEVKLKEWKHFIFKSPLRKNYKDLDNQVTSFLKKETSLFRKQDKQLVESNDWLLLSVDLLTVDHDVIDTPTQRYWIRMSEHQLSNSLQELCMGQQEHYSFITPTFPFISNESEIIPDPCHYRVTISQVVKSGHLNLNYFKNTFRVKTKAEVHTKLIEVFSYRNDISQRRAIIEEVFHLMFSKHRFEVPKHIVTRKQELLLDGLRNQPDYHVYKAHKDFNLHIAELAEKMTMEETLIDQITFNDGITVSEEDVAQYLHMMNNQRLKEFVYFKPLIESVEETDTPLHEHILAQAALREKTLNHIIHHLL